VAKAGASTAPAAHKSRVSNSSEKVRLTVIFAWRYADPIWRGNRQYMQDGGRFLVPLPSPHLLAEG
jgi:hypothetical protein